MIWRVSLALALAVVASAVSAAPCAADRRPLTLRLGDATSRGEVVLPTQSPRALVVLFAGSDVADLDGAVTDARGSILSRPLLQVADRLACAGYASLRYDKRHVSGPTTVDRARFAKLDGSDLADDGEAALRQALVAVPTLARLPVVVLGWSEGTTVAMAVATRQPSVRAIVLLAPVVESPARVAQAQWGRVGRPYLARFATDGSLDAAAVARAQGGGGGVLAQIFVGMFRGFRPGETLNPLLDRNHDGRIALTEADPIIAGWYADSPDSGLGIATTARALPGVAAALAMTTQPVLIVQGKNDSMIGPAAAEALASREPRVTLRTFSGLGHSLGAATSIFADNLAPVAAPPLDAITTFLDAVFVTERPSRP